MSASAFGSASRPECMSGRRARRAKLASTRTASLYSTAPAVSRRRRSLRKRLEGGMARITLDGIAHAYGGKPRSEQDYALKPLHHVWEQGMAYALLGPSGCGKTTLLNIISGLVIPSDRRPRQAGLWAPRGRQAEDLVGARLGSLGCIGRPVRRAADGDRSCAQVG